MNKTVLLFLLISVIVFTACGLLGSGKDSGSGPRSILFSGQTGGKYQIFAMREDGTGLKQLTTDGDQYAMNPAWSPDGSRIAFESSIKAPIDTPNLYVMDADGNNLHPLVTNPNTDGYPMPGRNPAWSPDGTKLAFDYCPTCEAGASNYDIFVVDLQSGTIDTLTHDPASDRFPTWSPDGKQIAFASDRDYADADTARYRNDLYIGNVDGSNLQKLTETGNAIRPAWNPQNDKIAFEWNIRGNEVFIYSISSDQIISVETGLEFAGGAVWNDNGTTLLVSGRKEDNAKPEIRFLNIDSGSPEILRIVNLDENMIGRDYDWHSNH